MVSDLAVRRAALADAEGRLLHDFNTEFDEPTPSPDVAARALYERLGFSNREGRPDGPLNYFYEREL